MDIPWILSRIIILFYAFTVMFMLLDVQWKTLSLKVKRLGMAYFTVLMVLNIWLQTVLDHQQYGRYYFLFAQLPLFVLFLIISDYRGIKLFFVLLTTVFFSSPTIILFSVLRSFLISPAGITLLCSFVMVFLIYRFLKKPFNYALSHGDNRLFLLFSAIPLLYYIYSYTSTRYQFSNMVADAHFFIRQMTWLIVLFSYILLLKIFQMVSEKAELENAQNLAVIQLNAATKQIEQLRINQQQSAIYHHDLRHHMNYLNACIEENKLQEASAYIRQTFDHIDSIKVERYSENEPLNLILSSYADKAKEKGIDMKITITASDFSRFYVTDLCSLLANALENAITAASRAQSADLRYITLRLYEKNRKLCLDLCNGYSTPPVFENDIPVSRKSGHGIGVKSMIHVVEQYKGVYRFRAEDGEFRFQVSM